MVSLYNYFIKSIFIRGIENPINSHIAPETDLSSLTEDEKKKIKYGVWEYTTNIVEESSTSLELTGLVRAFEKNNGRNIEDIINFKSSVTVLDYEVLVETDLDVSRKVEGEMHELQSVRDGLLPIGYQSTNHELRITEYYKVLSNGKRLLHYSPYSTGFEVYEMDLSVGFGEGIKYHGLKVFDSENYDMEDPDIEEIKSIINRKNDVIQLIRK